jgi:hypothetical protein
MKIRKLIPVSMLIALTCSVATAQDSNKILVSVNVSIDDQTLRDRVVSAVNRELRGLGDVTVVPNGYFALYALDIVGFTTENQAKVKTGFAVAVDFSSVVPMWAVKAACKESKLAGITVPFVNRVPDEQFNAKVKLDTLIHEDAPDEVEKAFRDIVAKFDAEVLVPERQATYQRANVSGTTSTGTSTVAVGAK